PDLSVTARLGQRLGELVRPGDLVLLTGPLGAGKTTLAQGIGRGAGVPESTYITSPTYNLLHEYPGRLPLYHLDLYRLGSEEEIEELGFLDYLYGRGAALIEWPDRLGRLKPASYLEVELGFAGENSRTALLTAVGEQWRERLKLLAALAGR
ncbi:MAG TPA: tRNA (adenosine(37)-N6)-threonylcarbamoyltransferase complex ATPase subunit type 1 TsaE, partial [Desulfurivibrionaceae bacterium]|nr:tRNA (adenosine(37)-N6)-threonylcarbamoyltransferase complex ATPase subunit type 1 TsaE [Desulfurivibrionaceae bacterium]